MSSDLALFGGEKEISYSFSPYNTIGEEELKAARKVIETGNLSQFIGAWDKDFGGGPKVSQFERAWAKYFGVRHAISVNSWTSGLIACVGSIGIEPGDEVIVSPWTMCASATAILHWNAIPVFADIEPETFCIDPVSIEKNISTRTRAIMAVDIFGQSADMNNIQKVADKYDLKIITDAAQAPGVKIGNAYAGTLADIGGYSLNYHKHIHTGEGGMIVTNNTKFAQRCRLIRNHAEAAIVGSGFNDYTNMLGYNFRLGEIECAIGLEQLKKLKNNVKSRQIAAEMLNEGLSSLPGLKTPAIRPECTHAYYVYGMTLDIERLGTPRTKILNALIAEGVPGLEEGYANLHTLPIFQKKTAYGSQGFPWTSDICSRNISYEKGICPVAEKLHDETYFGIELCMFEFSEKEVRDMIRAFHKVWRNMDYLTEADI